jgi:alpha-amylase
LTAEKYAGWLANATGECVNIFADYETFGEHHWPETGIHSFLQHLPDAMFTHANLRMATPSEIVDKYESAGEIDVPEAEGTVSWADIKRDQSGWLGNVMQWAYFTALRRLEPFIKEAGDDVFLRLWRDFQISDHLYYMFTAGGGPGEVHSYFSPYESPMDAFAIAQTLLADFEVRLRAEIFVANEPFLFHTGNGKQHFTGTMAWSLKGLIDALQKVSSKALEFHVENGDLEQWSQNSLKDATLAVDLQKIKESKTKGEALRKALLAVAKKRYFSLIRHGRWITISQ